MGAVGYRRRPDENNKKGEGLWMGQSLLVASASANVHEAGVWDLDLDFFDASDACGMGPLEGARHSYAIAAVWCALEGTICGSVMRDSRDG